MASTQNVSSKSPEEIVTLFVDFSPVAESVSAPAVISRQISGPTSSNLIVDTVVAVAGPVVSVKVSGGINGAKYKVSFYASLPNGDRYVQHLILPVVE